MLLDILACIDGSIHTVGNGEVLMGFVMAELEEMESEDGKKRDVGMTWKAGFNPSGNEWAVRIGTPGFSGS